MNSTKTAVYMRFSTEKQDAEAQKHAIATFLTSNSIEGAQFYQDEGLSGKNTDRPAFKALLNDLKAGKVKRVIVYKLDRLSRSLIDLLGLLKTFTDHGAELVSIKENLDLGTASGRLMMQIVGAFGEYEREMIVNRTRDGLKAAKAKGQTLGRRPTISSEIQARVLSHLKDGLTYRTIARLEGISIGTISLIKERKSIEAPPNRL